MGVITGQASMALQLSYTQGLGGLLPNRLEIGV